MCTLIVSVGQYPSAPLLVAANRDELRQRPASPPHRWVGEDFVAPRDDQAGGTWLGLTKRGLFVAVTNRYPSDRHPDRESRGTLVLEALRASSAAALRAQLAPLTAERFNTFHLLYADAKDAFVTWNDGQQVHHKRLGRGLHVITERSLGGDDEGRAPLVSRLWPTLKTESGVPSVPALQGLLSSPPPDGVLVDIPDLRYGTRSSLVLRLAPRLADSRWWWCEGRPDQNRWAERPDLIASLCEETALSET